ncbi:MAG: diadenylate cyclase CdaA [Clostridia bacterium]|nr:diadenylate cyclase CdaA [Clostridia bacterium]
MAQYLPSLIRGMGFSDVVDILIVSYIIFKLLGFIQSTRAAQLAKGLGIVVAAYLASDLFNFYTVNWLLSKVLSIGLIALVVVFQPELRRALEYLGRGKFSTKGFSMEREKINGNIQTIVRAVEYFAARKEGALIVIENDTALQDIAENGTLLDAQLTEPLLENIFYKGSPLHDGAAILRGDRILAAGCVLPLTENPNLSKDLGTRHRAGIGMSENSDATVLIVSEETGIISMAQNGKLSRFLDLKAVEKNLYGIYLKKTAPDTPPTVLAFGNRRKDADGKEHNS